MESRKLGEIVGVTEDVIKRACSLAMAARDPTTAAAFVLDKPRNSSHAIFAFAGSWFVGDWFGQSSFGESKINLGLFPSLRSVGNDEIAIVNGAFLRQFESLLRISSLSNEVNQAMTEKKQIVFTGHSSGSSVAVLATIWLLEECKKLGTHNYNPPSCVTFGSPLIGDRIFGHALRRENWSRYFVNFVMRYDVVPRIFLTPLPSIEQGLQTVLQFFNTNSIYFQNESLGNSRETSDLFNSVMRNASSVASHAACVFMGCTNSLLEAVTSFIELSPYRPCGTYVFCTGNGKLITMTNPDAILQLLFYSLQLGRDQEVAEIAYRSLKEHLLYQIELQGSLEMQDLTNLDHLEELPFSPESCTSEGMRSIDIALKDIGLSTRARLCLRAAGELENQKLRNQAKILANYRKIEDGLNFLCNYRTTCEVREIGYYDAFRLQRDHEDFDANVKRLELAGLWDEIVEMLRRYELPDSVEVQRDSVDLGTRYRRLVEPLDIANYYRHLKNEDTGPYMVKGRPKRYRYTQRWLEHAHRMPAGTCSESCFWAELEELCIHAGNRGAFDEVKERVLRLEEEVLKWVGRGIMTRDVFLEESTFVKWWTSLPHQHRIGSTIARLMNGEGRDLPAFS